MLCESVTAIEGAGEPGCVEGVCQNWEIAALIVKPLILRAVDTPIYPTPQGRCCVRGAGQI